MGSRKKKREYLKEKIENVHYKHRKSLHALKAVLMVNGVNVSISTLSQMSKGTNKYRLPHINKKKLRKEGRLPENFGIDLTAYKVLVEHSNYLNPQKTKNKEDNEILQQVMNTVEI